MILINGSGTIRFFLKKWGCHGYMTAGNETEAAYLTYHITGLQENYVDGWQASGRVWLITWRPIVSAIQPECRLRRGEFVPACGAGFGMSWLIVDHTVWKTPSWTWWGGLGAGHQKQLKRAFLWHGKVLRGQWWNKLWLLSSFCNFMIQQRSCRCSVW